MKYRGKKGVLRLQAAAQAVSDKGSAGFHGQFVKNRPANGKGMVMKVFFVAEVTAHAAALHIRAHLFYICTGQRADQLVIGLSHALFPLMAGGKIGQGLFRKPQGHSHFSAVLK